MEKKVLFWFLNSHIDSTNTLENKWIVFSEDKVGDNFLWRLELALACIYTAFQFENRLLSLFQALQQFLIGDVNFTRRD